MGVRSLYYQHRQSGNLLARVNWKAPYRSIQESQFARYNREALFAAVGVYDRPGETGERGARSYIARLLRPGDTRESGARAYIARFLERGTKRRFAKSRGFARRGRIRPMRILEKGAKLSREEVKLTRAIQRAGRRAVSLRRRRTYKLTGRSV